eukprot:gb/GFBE01080165.1/.p1 GENE.gb/GFBE01080165.1/~~gb/GFBE01080165.1/.p1  ORF type:complete len:382 (+),score=85.77 gb/GFBE01080165.1/:1-1146(+)
MPAALSRPVRIGTDCSGMETPVMALKKLGVDYEHMFSCDIDKNVKTQILANFPPKRWFDDLMYRDNESRATPAVDLYVAGFPCQSFSRAGLQNGFKDDRGMVFFGCARFIDAKRPRAFILENVKGLLGHEKGKTFKKVMQTLKEIADEGYDVKSALIDTQDHGVPQSRPRVYIVGVRKDCKRGKFEFPESLPRVSIESFLDPVQRRPTMRDLPPKGNKTVYKNVTQNLAKLTAEGKKPLSNTFALDIDATPQWCTVMRDRTMCMTKSRPHGYWLTSRGRRMNLNEMLRCQGMQPGCFKQVVSDRAIGMQIGNAMSQNVIERILINLLPVAGLVQQDVRLVDRWANKAKKLAPSAADDELKSRKRTSSSSSSAPSSKRARTA